ncbi:MAG: HNH endonuclease signature motif containing protein [Spiroplasma sp.]|nr:HNH endonuclease signature motif containing protein [Spiroplasma sp.]
MKAYSYNYKHIVSDKIVELKKPHKLENIRDKSIFIDVLLKDLKILTFKEISKGKKNLFRIFYENIYYNIFIEFPDGGGTDISFNRTTKKIAIPYHIIAFKKLIDNYEPVLVINVYIPLSENLEPDYTKRVYLIVDPKEIYKSKVIEKETYNSSSRWVTLEDIKDVENNKTYKLNKKKNVYIVHWEKLKWFFNNILIKEYVAMLNSELNKMNLSELLDDDNRKYKKYRRLFRQLLISNRGTKCEMGNCKINILDLLIASHIKSVNQIINDSSLDKLAKILEISDPNNGLLLCPNHDALFDKHMITFNSEGILNISKVLTSQITNFNLINGTKTINVPNKKMIKYLKVHNKNFDLFN